MRQDPEGALPKGQRWTVRFLNDAVRSEFKALNPDLREAFWNLHDDIKFYGFEKITKRHAQRLAGTRDLWELRFKARSGIGRGLYVQSMGRTITVLVFFSKKSGRLPKQMLDLAVERRKTLEEVVVEALGEHRMAASPIDAEDVFDEEYPPGSRKRAEYEKRYLDRIRRRQRMDSATALPRRVKERFAMALRARLNHAAGSDTAR